MRSTLGVSALLASIAVASAIYAGLASGRSRWPAMVLCVIALSACIVGGGASAIMAARNMARPILAGALAVCIPLTLILIGYTVLGLQAESTNSSAVLRNSFIGAAVVGIGLAAIWVTE